MTMHGARRMGILLLVWVSWCAGVSAAPNGLVVLLTDYGADSIYVGILKGAIYTKWPGARVETLTNSVPSFDIEAGGAILAEACREFPEGTTFCCVVDPGVGTERKCIAVETEAGQFFVAPDNGLLTAVVERDGIRRMREASNRRYWREGVVSSTFHGRDIFGPVSASVANGAVLRTLGSPVKEIVKIEIALPGVKDGVATGRVRRVDPYGNLVTDITGAMLEELGGTLGDWVEVALGDHKLTAKFSSTYASVPEGKPLVLVQSNGLVECAINQGSMAEDSGATFHTPVTLRLSPKPLAALCEADGAAVNLSVTVYPDGTGVMFQRGITRQFKLSEDRVQALRKLVPAAPNPRLPPDLESIITVGEQQGPIVSFMFGDDNCMFLSPEDVPETLRPIEAALRKIGEEQIREQIRPRVAP